MKTESPIKILGSKWLLLDRLKKCRGHILWVKFCFTKSPFFFVNFWGFLAIFAIFFVVAIFGPFEGRYQVCWMKLGLTSTMGVKLQHILCFIVIFGHFLVNFCNFLSSNPFLRAFFAICPIFRCIF